MGSEVVLETIVALVSLVDETYVYGLQSSGVLAHPIRHRVVSILIDRGGLRRADLADRLADDDTLPQDDSRRLEIELHHNHLPRLDDELVVEYDPRTGDVLLWKDPETAAKMLESS